MLSWYVIVSMFITDGTMILTHFIIVPNYINGCYILDSITMTLFKSLLWYKVSGKVNDYANTMNIVINIVIVCKGM